MPRLASPPTAPAVSAERLGGAKDGVKVFCFQSSNPRVVTLLSLHALSAGTVLLLALQAGLQALLDEALTQAFDGGDADFHGPSDRLVRPGGSALSLVGLKSVRKE